MPILAVALFLAESILRSHSRDMQRGAFPQRGHLTRLSHCGRVFNGCQNGPWQRERSDTTQKTGIWRKKTAMFPLLHFSDCHLFSDPDSTIYGVCSADALAATLTAAQKQAASSQMAIITGDLSQDGSLESYALAEKMFARLHIPVYAVPGNHDCVGPMASALTGHPIAWKRSIMAGDWHMIFLNSTLPDPDNPAGRLPEEELAALEAAVTAKPEMPTLLVLHHQPLSLDTPWMNRMALANPDALFRRLADYPWVRALLFGHIHHAVDQEHQGIRLLSAPSTCVQFATKTEHPVFVADDTGYRWLRLYPDGKIETGINRVRPV